MNFIKAIRLDDQTEIINLDKVVSIRPQHNDVTTVLMAPGLWFEVYTSSITAIECKNELFKAIAEG